MNVLYLLVAIIVLNRHSTIAEDPLSLISTVESISKNIYETSRKILAELSDIKLLNYHDRQEQLLLRLKPIFNQIKQLESQNQQRRQAAKSVFEFVDMNVPFSFRFMTDQVNWVLLNYEEILDLQKNHYSPQTLRSLALWATGTELDGSPSYLSEFLHQKLLNNGTDSSSSENILSQLVRKYMENNKMRNTNQSAQQFIYNLYSEFAILELKAFFSTEFGYMALRIFYQGGLTQDEEEKRSSYVSRSEQTVNMLKEAMRSADRSVWRSDPKVHIPNVTFDEVTRLLQGYIENEVDMDESGSCSKDCAAFDKAESRRCYEGFCEHQDRCSGELRNCRFIKSDMSVCQAPTNSHRRYNYIEYENGPLFGDKNSCESNTIKVESWNRWIFQECSYCFCLCDEEGQRSDRFFNLRETVADVKENKVVTGLRFVKKNRIFHLQIQQGKLLPYGNVETSSVDWKPVDAYNIYEENVVSGVDYHTMSYSSRSLDLDDNISRHIDADYVITGVRFRVLRSHLNLMVRFSKFDFDTGKLLDPEVSSEWKSKDSENRQQLNLNEMDLPTRTIAESMPISTPNHYLQFGNSGMEKDVAQTTVPFIDIQDVVSNPPVPLSGLGIYYKSSPGYGGFVAPKIITFDFSTHL